MAKKNYLLDTSVYLTDADAILRFGNHDVFIPLKVLEEIDKHKKRQDSVGSNARRIIRTLDQLRTVGDLQKGVRLGKGKGIIRVMSYASLYFRPISILEYLITSSWLPQRRCSRNSRIEK